MQIVIKKLFYVTWMKKVNIKPSSREALISHYKALSLLKDVENEISKKKVSDPFLDAIFKIIKLCKVIHYQR